MPARANNELNRQERKSPIFIAARIEIIKKISEFGWKMCLKYVKKYFDGSTSHKSLWGLVRCQYFEELNLVFFFQHYCFNVAYDKLTLKFRPISPLGSKTIRRNVQKIRELLYRKGKRQIKPGTKEEWNKATKKRNIKNNPFGKFHLLLDSTDIKMWKATKKNHWYSFKLSGPAIRIQILCDFLGKIVYCSKMLTPKMYDGHWLLQKIDSFEKKFMHAKIVADNHYGSAKKEFSTIIY